jgi:hypothetical protein
VGEGGLAVRVVGWGGLGVGWLAQEEEGRETCKDEMAGTVDLAASSCNLQVDVCGECRVCDYAATCLTSKGAVQLDELNVQHARVRLCCACS